MTKPRPPTRNLSLDIPVESVTSPWYKFQSTAQYFVSCPHLLQSCTNVHSFARSVAFASCLHLEISICFLHSVDYTKNFSYIHSNLLRNTLSATFTCFRFSEFLYVFFTMSITPRVPHISVPIYFHMSESPYDSHWAFHISIPTASIGWLWIFHPIGNIVSRKRVPSQSADWMIKVHSGYSCKVATVESERIWYWLDYLNIIWQKRLYFKGNAC